MRKSSITTLASVFCALAIAAIPLHASSIFINGDVVVGQGTPFSDPNNGITANFSCSTDTLLTSGCMTSSTTGSVSWSPEMLITVDFPSTVTIGFSGGSPTLLDSISMDFGTLPGDTIELVAYLGGIGGTEVGSTSATGTVVVGLAEGTNFSFSGGTFDTVQLSDSDGLIAVGNITVTADAPPAPEPSYFWMFPAIGLGLAIRKRRG